MLVSKFYLLNCHFMRSTQLKFFQDYLLFFLMFSVVLNF